MVHPGKPPLPLNKLHCWPLNYPKYVKDSKPDAHIRIFKVVIKANSETNDAKIINLFSFSLRDIVSDWCHNYLGDYPNCIFAKLQLAFCKRYRKVQNDEQVYL